MFKELKNEILKIFFSYDSNISSYFLEQYQKGLRFFFLVGVISYSAYSVFDFLNQYYHLLYLRLFVIILCSLPIIFYQMKLGFTKIKYVSNLSLFFILLLEIETQMRAPDVPFFHSSSWFVDILVILIHSMYFQGTPNQYSLYWLTLILYYCARSFLKVDGDINHVIINVWMYHLEAWLFGCVFNFWWFQIRYERTVNDIRLKEEYEKRISIEKELTRIKEREAIFADIHDNLGGKLLDLSLQLNSLKNEKKSSEQLMEKIEINISDVLKNLRNRLLVFEDMSKIEKNFSNGLRFFLIRRYSLAERKIQFVLDNSYREGLIQNEKYIILLNIISELVNNDLKYGYGIAKWTISALNDEVLIQLCSNTHWNQMTHSIRNGHLTIRQRIESIGAKFHETIDRDKYLAQISFAKGI